MLSLTSQYALRAIIYLAQHVNDWPIPGRQVARDAQIPAKYLSKILGDLVRSGVLESSPGKTGGFRLRRSSKATYLHEVLEPFQQLDQQRCPFDNQECTDLNPCRAHSRWKRVVEAEQYFFKKTSVYDVAVRVPAKKGTAGRKTA